MFSSTLSKVACATTVVLFTMSVATAQKKNELLDRSFWKGKPGVEAVKQKVAEGNDPAQIDQNQFDAVSLAINSEASNDVVYYLLEQEGNGVNKKTHDGRTYMFWATVKNNFELMDVLVKKGTNMKHVDEKGSSIMVYNALNGNKNTKVYDYLIANGTDIKTEKNKAGASVLLLICSHLKSIEEAAYFLDKGLTLKDVDNNGYGIFAYASKGGNQSFMKELIAAGCDPKAVATDGGNAFMMATQGSRTSANGLDFYLFLEKLGINPNTKTTSGTNPMHNVARSKDSSVVAYFLNKGCDVNAADKEGNTPLMLAAGGQQDLGIFTIIFEKGKDWNHKNNEGQTALTLAVASNSTKVGLLLIGAGASVTVVDNDGNNLSYYLVKHYKKLEDYTAKMKMLYTFGFKHNQLQANDNTLFHVAVREKKMELIKVFTDEQLSGVNALNKDGMSPLHLAASSDDYGKYILLLVEIGADKSLLTEFGETAYDLATENELLNANKIDYSFLK